MKPAIPLHDKRFVWTSAVNTDIRIRFQQERERIKAQAKVAPIKRRQA